MPKFPRMPVLLAPLLFAGPALAQEAQAPALDPARLEGDSLMVGLGAGAVPSYEGSDDTVFSVVPLVRGRVSGINFALRGNRAWADVIPTSGGPGWDAQLGPVLNVNFDRSAAIVDPQVRKLGRKRTAIETGAFVGLGRQGLITSDYDKLTVSVSYVQDINRVHRSYVITPSIDYGTPLSTKAYVGISASADFMGGGYADTYFSVDPAGAAASGLPVFTARRGWKDWTLSALGDVAISGDLTHGLGMIGGVSYRRLVGDAARTPITSQVGSSSQWTGVLGLAYTF